MKQRFCRHDRRVAALLALFAIAGCGGGAASRSHAEAQPHPDDLRGVVAAERAAGRGQPAGEASDRGGRRTPAAIVNGQYILWEDLRPALTEAAGGLVLQEQVLDLMLAAEARRRGIVIGPAEVSREREFLMAAIVRESRATPGDAERLLASVQRTRGLGEARFARLLERNAHLRALVADEVEVLQAEVDREYLIRHGPRFRVRVIMTATQREAAEIRSALAHGDGGLTIRFAEAAARASIDPSAERGGIVDPISPSDPSYPASIRQAVETLQPGTMSDVLAVDRGFAILLLEERIAGDGVELPDVQDALREELQRRAERLAMDDLARRLLREADVSVTDRALDWSWRAGAGGR